MQDVTEDAGAAAHPRAAGTFPRRGEGSAVDNHRRQSDVTDSAALSVSRIDKRLYAAAGTSPGGGGPSGSTK